LHVNGDDVDLLHFTDADAVMLFRKANVLFAADLFNNTNYTRVDLRGGSLDGMITAYDKLLPTLDDKVKVVPGRGPVGAKKDLIALAPLSPCRRSAAAAASVGRACGEFGSRSFLALSRKTPRRPSSRTARVNSRAPASPL